MSKTKKVLALLLCAVLLVGATITGTLAYLSQTTETVTNTFTVGKVSLGTDTDNDGIVEGGLDEAKVNEYGVKYLADDVTLFDEKVHNDETLLAKRVTANSYKLIPGHTYVKDPTIHVQPGSEECYLFVKVVNEISAIEAADNATTIAGQMATNGWVQLEVDGVDVANVFYKSTNVDTTEAEEVTDVDVFKSFTIGADKDVSGYAGKTITVTAYAIQADGFTDAAAAWKAAPDSWK